KNATDPHAWMDARNGLIYIENIKNALIELDPDNREVYEFNYGVYRQQLEDLDRYIEEQIQRIPPKQRILITSHDAFHYYGKRYGLRLESILGISTDAEAQTSDIVRLNRVIRENQVPAVFIESTVNPKLLEQIAHDNNVAIGGKLYSDSIGGPDSPAPSYYDMLKYNTDTIVEALSRSAPPEPLPPTTTRFPWFYWAGLGLLLAGGFLLLFRKINGQ
ncbi:MAG: LPXTG cell wall anchor domain-containing protein, partial [Bacteroidetes bacterium]